MDALKVGCFKYFERGGDCVAGPVGLLSGQVNFPSTARLATVLIHTSSISPSFFTLFRHFFAVAFYSVWVLFTQPRLVPGRTDPNGKPLYATPGIDEYPVLFIMSIQTVGSFSIPSLVTDRSLPPGVCFRADVGSLARFLTSDVVGVFLVDTRDHNALCLWHGR